jgi:BirA family transcriptional regulator, biotin operon repressor / biotin---[acetyl-CoA-carboxylase] ligase
VVALALIDVLSQFVDDVSIKWPNDIYVGDNKIAGILIENTLLGNSISNSIIGIGLNVNQLKFTSNAPNPISLKQITGNDFNIENLLQRYMTCFFDRYLQWIEQDTDSELTNLYIKHLYRSTGYHKYSDSTGLFMAKFERIKETGHLVLQTDKGENRIFAFKEVSYII